MNPFESGLVAANGLNAVMSRRTASRATRTVQGREYRFFYNPRWGHLGDRIGDTAGTYYCDNSAHVNYFWHVFDLVLIRPDLANGFNSDKLKILTTIGQRSLVRTIVEFSFGLYEHRWTKNERYVDIACFVLPRVVLRPATAYLGFKLLSEFLPAWKNTFHWAPFFWGFLASRIMKATSGMRNCCGLCSNRAWKAVNSRATDPWFAKMFAKI